MAEPRNYKDFATYAERCFQKFGDRLRHWITFNEPHNVAVLGYDLGFYGPGRCTILVHCLCKDWNFATEPYIVAYGILLSLALVTDIAGKNYKHVGEGSVGISLDVIWLEPATDSEVDIAAIQRALDFQFGW